MTCEAWSKKFQTKGFSVKMFDGKFAIYRHNFLVTVCRDELELETIFIVLKAHKIKLGLKSKRTPPLYEKLIQELGFEENDKIQELEKENAELIEKYRQAVDKCLHITFIGCGCEVHTIAEYATLVDGYLTDVEGLAKWKN